MRRSRGPRGERSRRRPRVLLVIENVPLARDHRARKQVEALLGAGYEVGVISQRDRGNDRYRRVEGLRLYEYPRPPQWSGKLGFVSEYAYSLLAAGTLAFRAILDGGVDIVQVGHPPDIYFLLGLPLRLAGRPFIVDQRDLSPEVFAARYGRDRGWLVMLLHLFERLSWRLADHVLCVNGSLRDTIMARGALPDDRVTVVGNGPVLARTARREPRRDLKEGRRFLVCWLGLMGPQDHVVLAVEAAHHLLHTLGRDDCHFVFIGEGESLAELKGSARSLGVADRVTFTGWLDEGPCYEYLSIADLGLDTNLQEEVTPVKGLEYMAFGLPIVAFDLEETRVMAGEAASYVTPGDPLELARAVDSLLDTPARRARMGRFGRERVEKALAWERQEEVYVALYRRLLLRGADDSRNARRLRGMAIGAGPSLSEEGYAGCSREATLLGRFTGRHRPLRFIREGEAPS
jgi:glycosyltransferase involved in cell wall biosynthesis